MRRVTTPVLVMVPLVAFLIVGSATVADASVSLTPLSALGGTVADLTFHVTNGQSGVITKQVEVTFPVAPAVTDTSAAAPPGWNSTVDASTGSVATVVFNEGTLAPGASGDFVLTMTIPNIATRMTFRIQQTYSDGTTTLADTASVDITAGGTTTTPTSAPAAASTTSTTPAATTTTLAAAEKLAKSTKSWNVGKVFIAIGGGVGLLMLFRVRRIRK